MRKFDKCHICGKPIEEIRHSHIVSVRNADWLVGEVEKEDFIEERCTDPNCKSNALNLDGTNRMEFIRLDGHVLLMPVTF